MRNVVDLRWECECGEGMQVNVLALYFSRYLCGNILSIEEDQSHAQWHQYIKMWLPFL